MRSSTSTTASTIAREEAIADFNEKFGPLTKNLKDILAKTDDNAEFYDYIKQIKAGKGGPRFPITKRLVMSQLNDKTLLKTFAWVDELNHELAMLRQGDKAWQTTASRQRSAPGANGPAVGRRRPTPARSRAIASIASAPARSLSARRHEDQVRDPARRRPTSFLPTPRVVASPRTHKEEPIIVDDEHFQWKFDGEYWKDELGITGSRSGLAVRTQ